MFYSEQVVILDPIMNTSRDMESVQDVEVVSPSTPPVRAKRTYAEMVKKCKQLVYRILAVMGTLARTFIAVFNDPVSTRRKS